VGTPISFEITSDVVLLGVWVLVNQSVFSIIFLFRELNGDLVLLSSSSLSIIELVDGLDGLVMLVIGTSWTLDFNRDG